MKGMIVLLALVAGPVGAVDMTAKSNQELCIMRAVNLLSGDELAGSTSDIYAELARRSEPCADTALYTSIAAERVKMVNEAVAQDQSAPPPPPPRRNWADRLGDAARTYQRMQPAPQAVQRPVTTTCHQFTTGLQCVSQ